MFDREPVEIFEDGGYVVKSADGGLLLALSARVPYQCSASGRRALPYHYHLVCQWSFWMQPWPCQVKF